MKNLCFILEKPLLSLKDFCIIGQIKDCILDLEKGKIAYYLCNKDGNDFLLAFDQILSVKDAVVVADRVGVVDPLDVDFTTHTALLQKEVYQSDGTALGKVTDVLFDQKGFVSVLKVGEDEVKATSVAGVDQVVLLKPAQKRKYKRKTPSITALATVDSPVTILDESAHQDNQAKFVEADVSTENFVQTAPTKIIADYNFLLGRSLQEDLYTYNGELIAMKNTYVSVDVVERARQNGKLLELTLNSK